MNANASPLSPIADLSLADVLALLGSDEEKSLSIRYGGRTVQPGFHVTEVKAGSFVTLDCGGNPAAWQETILQVEDIPADPGQALMTVGKFRSILRRAERIVRLEPEARLTIEIGPPQAPMQVFDVTGVAIDGGAAILQLDARPAICKPRHRVEVSRAAACCGVSRG